MTRDRLEDAFLRLRAAAHADEYVPMEDVIEVVLAENERLRAEAEQADEEATTLANSDLATTEQVVRALRAENERLRAAAEEILSWPTRDMAMLLSNPPQNAALFRAQSVLRKALEKKP